MNSQTCFNLTAPSPRKLINRSLFRYGFPVVLLAITLTAFTLLPSARAVTPAPDGGYPNQNTAEGDGALSSNTTGAANTATGVAALQSNQTGNDNTATGGYALHMNTTGTGNTADGFEALLRNGGSDNTAVGSGALRGSFSNNNIGVGRYAGALIRGGGNNIEIGNGGTNGDANRIRIGTVGAQTDTFIAGIYGVTVPSGVGVVVSPNGHLGTVTSSARFKEAIKPMDKTSEAILNLKPVTFRYKEGLDPEHIPQFGLIAEEVEKVNPDLVVRDEEGKVNTVRYEAVNAMLLNEFLKEHRKVQHLEKQVAVLTAGLQKVTARIEAGNSASRVVSDN